VANSTSEAVGTAAKAIVDAIGITAGGGAVPSVMRKTPSVPEGAAVALPQFVVSVGAEGCTEYLTATQKVKTYPVAVTVVTDTGLQSADDPTVRQWRQQIELALEAAGNWSGLSGFNDAALTNRAPFDVAALGKDFNYSTVVAEVSVIETRG
jgi:hypothetical protein